MGRAPSLSTSPLLELDASETLASLLARVAETKSYVALVTSSGGCVGTVSLRGALSFLLKYSSSLSEALAERVESLAEEPRYVLSADAGLDDLRRLILRMRGYEPVVVLRGDRPVATITLGDMLTSLSFVRSSISAAVSRARSLGPLVAPNTTLKGCLARMLEEGARHAAVHRKGKVLGVVGFLDIVGCLMSRSTLRHVELGVDGYFFYVTCSTIMRRRFNFVVRGEYESAYDLLRRDEYLVVVDDGRRLVKFLSDAEAFALLQRVLRRRV